MASPGPEGERSDPLDARNFGSGIDFTDPASPLAPYYLTAGKMLAAILLGAIFLVANQMPLWHTDIWGHLKFGQWMVLSGALPTHAPFCDYADQAAPYVNFQWLSQALTYATYALGEWLSGGDELQRTAGGVEMLRLLFAVLVTARFGFLLAALWRLSSSPYVACAGVVVGFLLASANAFVLRPQSFGEVCCAVLLFLVSDRTLARRTLILIPILMVAWANLHGSYAVGLVILVAVSLGHAARWAVAGRLRTDSLNRRSLALRSAIVLGLSAAGIAVLNPHGPWLYWHTLELSRHPNIAAMDEWRRLAWDTPLGVAFLASLALVALTHLATLALVRPSREPAEVAGPPPTRFASWFSVEQYLLLLAFGWQTYLHQRMMPWWVLLIPWILAPHWAQILQRWPRLAEDHSTPSFRKTLIALLILWAMAMWSGPVLWALNREPRPLASALHPGTPWKLAAQLRNPSGDHLPAVARWLEKDFPGGKFQGRIFASETQGDYLLWTLSPDTPIFMFTHVHLFTSERWQEFRKVKDGTPDWQKVLDAAGVNLIVVEGETHPGLRRQILNAPDRWQVLVDETRDPSKGDAKSRILIAGRKQERTAPSLQ